MTLLNLKRIEVREAYIKITSNGRVVVDETTTNINGKLFEYVVFDDSNRAVAAVKYCKQSKKLKVTIVKNLLNTNEVNDLVIRISDVIEKITDKEEREEK